MTLITGCNLSLMREGRTVLSGLHFTVEEGQLLCITGENGAGKSTLLAALLGELAPSAGKLDCRAVSARGAVGYVPQRRNAKLDLPASVNEVVLSGRLARSGFRPFYNAVDRADAAARLSALGISDLADWRFGALSGGQQQRVLLARALCAAGRLLVLDEPLASLDNASAERLWSVLTDYVHAGGAAVMVTHDIAGVRRHADMLLHLANGRAAWYGPAAEAPKGGFSHD